MANHPDDAPRPTRQAAHNQTLQDIVSNREPLPEPEGITPASRVAGVPGGVPPAKAEYELGGSIGTGGMGDVVSALHRPTNREVALKFALPRHGLDTDEHARLLWEAQTIARLEHPGVIPLYDIGLLDAEGAATPPQKPFYAMRKIPAGRTWSQRRQELTLAENLEILHRVCDAVAFAHSRSILHRDLKPDNVMLGEYGEVFVMDWGLAASWGEAAKRRDSARPLAPDDGGAMGSPSYAAPEQIRRDVAAIGVATDVYLLGATLFELLTGQPPHGIGDTATLLRNARENRIVVPNDTPEEHRGLLAIASKAMASDPAARHREVREFQADLRVWDRARESFELIRLGRGEQEAATVSAREGKSAPVEIYARFDKAARLYATARDLVPDMGEAIEAKRGLGFAYAAHALAAGDLDLARTKLPELPADSPDTPDRARLRKEIAAAVARRAAGERRARQMKWGLGAAAVICLGVYAGMTLRIETVAERARRDDIMHADVMYASARALRLADSSWTGYILRDAKNLYERAGVPKHSVDVALWDYAGVNGVQPEKSAAGYRLSEPRAKITKLPPPFDGSQSLPERLYFDENEPLAVLPADNGISAALYHSPDNSSIITLRQLDPEALVLEVNHINSDKLFELAGEDAAIAGGEIAADSQTFAVWLTNGDLWRMRLDGNKAKRLPYARKKDGDWSTPHAFFMPGIPAGLASSRDGKLIVAVAREDGAASAVDTETWRVVGTRPGIGEMPRRRYRGPDLANRTTVTLPPVAINHDNSLAAIDYSDHILLWSLREGTKDTRLPPCPEMALALRFDAEDSLYAYTTNAVYAYQDGAWMNILTMAPPVDRIALPEPYAVSPDGRHLLRLTVPARMAQTLKYKSGDLFILEKWDVEDKKMLWQKTDLASTLLSWSPDGGHFVVREKSGKIGIHAATTGDVVEAVPINTHRGLEPFTIAFSPDGRYLALAYQGNRFKLWDRKDQISALDWPLGTIGQGRRSWPQHNPAFFLPDGGLVYSDPTGMVTPHLFPTKLLVSRKTSLEPAWPKSDSNDNIDNDEEYRFFNGGALVRIDLPRNK